MENLDLIYLISSLSSIILAIIAIWLSIKFYDMSSSMFERARTASEKIGSSVVKLEEFFNSFYTDTFSMMKEQYKDISKHAWSTENNNEIVQEKIEEKLEAKTSKIKEDFSKDLNEILSRQKISEKKISSINKEVVDLTGKVINRTKEEEEAIEEEAIGEFIVSVIDEKKDKENTIIARELVDYIENKLKLTTPEILKELRLLKDIGVISWRGHLLPRTKIRLKRGQI